jgi:hypothetical protein
MVEAYRDGHITLRELMEELEWYCDRKIYRRTRAPAMERASDPMTVF